MDYEDALLSLIGHMLRQNLINITELSNLMLVESDGVMTDSARADDIAQIKVEAAEALGTIDVILRLARANNVPGTITLVNLSSFLKDTVPRCAEKALVAHSSLCIDSVTLTEGSFQSNISALEGAITKAVAILSELHPGCLIHFSGYETDSVYVLNFQTAPDQGLLIPASITEIFKKSRDVNTLIEMLTCIRLVHACGLNFRLLRSQSDELNITVQIQIPSRFITTHTRVEPASG